jgi:hypothetical protein
LRRPYSSQLLVPTPLSAELALEYLDAVPSIRVQYHIIPNNSDEQRLPPLSSLLRLPVVFPRLCDKQQGWEEIHISACFYLVSALGLEPRTP